MEKLELLKKQMLDAKKRMKRLNKTIQEN